MSTMKDKPALSLASRRGVGDTKLEQEFIYRTGVLASRIEDVETRVLAIENLLSTLLHLLEQQEKRRASASSDNSSPSS